LIRKLMRRGSRPLAPPPGEVDRAEWMLYIKHLREGMIAFDVGAHVGELSLLFSRLVGTQGLVHSFEASSATFERLRTICELAGRRNVVLNHLAVAEKEGTVRLYCYDEQHSGWNTLAERPLHAYGIDVEPVATEDTTATTIDAYCQETGIPAVDLLKIDVEGAEYQVLLGARRMLQAKAIGLCTFEVGKTTFDMGNDPREIQRYLSELDYESRNVVRGAPALVDVKSVDEARFSMYVAQPRTGARR
jgi:FkbM family methyltransferase